jgi:hypothetical protein
MVLSGKECNAREWSQRKHASRKRRTVRMRKMLELVVILHVVKVCCSIE